MKVQNNPWFQQKVSTPAAAQVPSATAASAPISVEVSAEKPAKHVPHNVDHHEGAFPIQKPVLSYTGEIIIENTVGGLDFDCRGLPTGHWRDPNFCDVFHACVYGYHRKSYTCPIVGLRTYFDEMTQKCEFVLTHPGACSLNRYIRK